MAGTEDTALSGTERLALDLARAAQQHAHAPFSGKHVGAAVITSDGAIFAGCNVENGTHELDICAEHNAITTAVAAGHTAFVTVVVIAPDERFWPPCASCREVIMAFATNPQVVMSTRDGRLCRARLSQLPARPFADEADAMAQEETTPVIRLTAAELARHIDHTNLRPDATAAEIVTLCTEARQHGFAAVCVNPAHVATAAAELRGTSVAVCGVVGFPTGVHATQIKVAEAVSSVRDGAREIDMVANAGWLKEGNDRRYVDDIHAVRYAIGDDLILKVIIEAALLDTPRIERAALLAVEGGANFVKTSTGVYGRARLEDVRLLRSILPPYIKIKAAGGIRTHVTACAFIAAGAERIGTSSSTSIVRSLS